MTNSKGALRLLVVHSSAELYGSDRSLLDFVRYSAAEMQITVALPEAGVLVAELEKAGAVVIVGEVCKIQRGMFSPRGMLGTVLAAIKSVRFLGAARRSAEFDLVYSNTVAVLGGALCARLWGVPHVWHVREILAGSRVLTLGFQHLVARLSSDVVCNSGQTRDWIRLERGANKYRVIWNGFDVPHINVDRKVERLRLGADDENILFVLVGRINAWKGQKLLVEAYMAMPADIRARARVAIVGSAPTGQEHYEQELAHFIGQHGCADRVKVFAYRADIEPVWLASDVVVVPSTEPEPFGRVAIEAMGFSRPVIAAAHGGLVEIVVDGETGRLVTPRDASSLAVAMSGMVTDAAMCNRMGQAGRMRQLASFSVGAYASQLNLVMHSAVSGQH